MTDNTIMADCIAADVPELLASRFGHQPAQAYVTGGWPVEWSDPQILAFPRHIRTAQSPVIGLDDVSDARELDVETGTATPEDWPDFWLSREDKDRATAYCSLITVPRVLEACAEAKIPDPSRWRLAWWWKNAVTPAGASIPIPDDIDVPAPTIEEIQLELVKLTRVALPAKVIWAGQFAMYRHWDLSKVYGPLDYARR